MIAIGEAQGTYNSYVSDRDQYLNRARECSKLTIPTLIPPSRNTPSTKYPTPYQSLGARGVNNLASKLLLALLPPNAPFFKLTVDDFTLVELTQDEGKRAKVEQGLASIERAVQTDIETSGIRVQTNEAIKHLIVGGNVLLNVPTEGNMRVFHLDKYVCKRTPDGRVIHMIVEEGTTPLALSPAVREACDVSLEVSNGTPKPVNIYTVIQYDFTGKVWKVHQEINQKLVPGSESTHPLDKSPWIPLRFIAVDNEDYGRGFVEEYIGDLKSLEGLTAAIVEGSAAAAKVLIMVKPNGSTTKKTVEEASNGAIIQGDMNDVGVLQLNKFADFRIAQETARDLTERLSFAFMLNSAVQRSGERVTAEEIRYMAGELEDALGGVYSILSQEFQLPLVNRIMNRMEMKRKLPSLPKDTVKPTITTGLEALGRGHDLNKLDLLMKYISPLGGEIIQTYMNVGDYITRVSTSLGIDAKGLINDDDQIKQQQQMQTMMQMLQRAAPNMVNQLGNQGQPTQ